MRIVVDGTSLLSHSAGVKTYMYYWIRALQQCAAQDSVYLFPFLGSVNDLVHETSSVGRLQTSLGSMAVRFANAKWSPALEIIGCVTDVFHASQHLRNPPHFTTHLTATIYDLTCWLMPELHVPANVAATRQYAESTLKRASGCIAISEQSKSDAIDVLKLSSDRIQVIYPGVADSFFSVTKPQSRVVADKYLLDKPYFLYVGMIEPRKNIDRLLDAYRLLSSSVRDAHDLVIAGPLGWCAETTKKRLLSPEPGVRYLGYIAEADLPALTAGASAFVFPAHYEGFGLPLAQAMACGVPAITSQGSSLAEIASDCAILVDPTKTDMLAEAMQKLALSPSLQEDLGRRGRERAARFTWERSAQQSLEFFHKIAHG